MDGATAADLFGEEARGASVFYGDMPLLGDMDGTVSFRPVMVTPDGTEVFGEEVVVEIAE